MTSNKDMACAATASDYDKACNTAIASTPTGDGMVQVCINGLLVSVGDGIRTKDCYFSADGSAARAIADIVAGDFLYWVGSVAGWQLLTTDVVSFIYAV